MQKSLLIGIGQRDVNISLKSLDFFFFSWSRKEIIFGEWWDRGKSSFEKRGIGLENHKNTSRGKVIGKGFIEADV